MGYGVSAQQPMAVNPTDKAIKAKFGKLFTYSQTLLNKMLSTRQVHDAKWKSMHKSAPSLLLSLSNSLPLSLTSSTWACVFVWAVASQAHGPWLARHMRRVRSLAVWTNAAVNSSMRVCVCVSYDEQRAREQSGDNYARHKTSKLSSRSSPTTHTATSSPSTVCVPVRLD